MKKLRRHPAKIAKYSLLTQLWLLVVASPLCAQRAAQSRSQALQASTHDVSARRVSFKRPPAQDSAFQSIEKTEEEENIAVDANGDVSAAASALSDADAAGGVALKIARPNGWNVLFGVVESQATNVILNAGIRIADAEFGKSSLASIKRNLTTPWALLDQSRFVTNMLGHPYQGVLYYQAGRANNWGFYGSAANALLGSLVWEIAGETGLPSVNDIITTPLAGIVFGEALHRLYYSAENLPGVLRFFISPFDFINRYIPGENPPAKPTGELWQLDASAGLFFGVQSRVNPTGEGVGNSIAPGASVALNAVYGNPFATYVPWSDPFRAFELSIAIDGSYPVYQVAIFAGGMLYSMPYATKKTEGVAGLSLHYDVLWGANVSFGGTSLDFTLTNRRLLPFGSLDFKMHAGALLFGSANTFNAKDDLSGWADDEIQVYGSGANVKFSVGISDTPAGDFVFSSAFYLMPLYYDKAGYADWGDMALFWYPTLSYSFKVTPRLSLFASVSDAFCVEFFSKRENITENTLIVRIAAGYRFRSGDER